MASKTLQGVTEKFPIGTSVTPYPVPSLPVKLSGTPRNVTGGSAATVASDGSLTFTGLTPGRYVAYAQVSGVDRYLYFTAQRGTSVIPVATTSTAVVAANPKRTFLDLENTSDTDIRVDFGSTATTSSPIVVYANGGTYSRDKYTGSLAAIHSASGTKNLSVVEG